MPHAERCNLLRSTLARRATVRTAARLRELMHQGKAAPISKAAVRELMLPKSVPTTLRVWVWEMWSQWQVRSRRQRGAQLLERIPSSVLLPPHVTGQICSEGDEI